MTMPRDMRLTPEEHAHLTRAGGEVRELHQHLDRLERAGVDVSAEREQLHQADKIRQGFLREFGRPGRAPRP